jgi:hypothetical protein
LSAATFSNRKLALSPPTLSSGCLLAKDWQEREPTGPLLAKSDIGCSVVRNGLASGGVLGTNGSEFGLRPDKSTHANQLIEAGTPPRASGQLGVHLAECRSLSPESYFTVLVKETAYRVGVAPRALGVRALLQLPRVASHKGRISRRQVQRELRICAERLRSDERAARSYVPAEKFQLHDLIFQEVDSGRALPVLASLHYLRSARPGSRHFALVDPIDGLPVTMCSMSPLEWKCVGSRLWRQFAISPDRVGDVSRVYSVDLAPANAVSLLLSRVRKYVRHNRFSVDILVTAVDPNLGFTGSSYRASNWQQWMSVQARPYLYEDGLYASPRQLRERFGTSNISALQANFPEKFHQSRVKLLDSMIFCFRVNGKTEVLPTAAIRRLHR